MATDPADRQQAIDVMTQVLLDAAPGHDQQEAQEAATALVDQAIEQRGG